MRKSTHERTHARTHERTNERTNERMNARMQEQEHVGGGGEWRSDACRDVRVPAPHVRRSILVSGEDNPNVATCVPAF